MRVLAHWPPHHLAPFHFHNPWNQLMEEAAIKKSCSQSTSLPQTVKTFLLCCHRQPDNIFASVDISRHLFSCLGMFSTPKGLMARYVREKKLPSNYFDM